MKFARIVIMALVIVGLIGAAPTSVMAAGVFPGYTSGISIQNLDAADASATLLFYNQDGSLRDSIPVTITGGSVAIYAALPLTTTDAFNGSLVVSSDKPLAVIANILNSAGTARASYDGASTGSTTVSIPLLQKSNGGSLWTSYFSVQNAGSGSTSVTVNYPDCATPAQTPVSIPEGSSHTFDQATETCHTLKAFSATLSSTNPVVVVVVQESLSRSSMLAYTGFGSSGNADIKIPLVNIQSSSWGTGIQIFNTSTTTDTNLKLTFLSGDGVTTCYETQTIPHTESRTFGVYSFLTTPPAGVTTNCNTIGGKMVGTGFLSSASDNSGGVNLVAVINETKGSLAGSYTSFAASQGTAQVNFPLIMDRVSSPKWGTGFYVMNVGTSATFVRCTFTNSSVVQDTGTTGLAANAAMVRGQSGAISTNYVGAATCKAYTSSSYATVDTSAKLVGVINQIGTGTGDLLLVSEGANVVP
jgi:hypothetical protein